MSANQKYMTALEFLFNLINPQPPKKPNWLSMRYHRWKYKNQHNTMEYQKKSMMESSEYVFFEIKGDNDLFISKENNYRCGGKQGFSFGIGGEHGFCGGVLPNENAKELAELILSKINRE